MSSAYILFLQLSCSIASAGVMTGRFIFKVIFRGTVPITVNQETRSAFPVAALGIFAVIGAVAAGYYLKRKKGL